MAHSSGAGYRVSQETTPRGRSCSKWGTRRYSGRHAQHRLDGGAAGRILRSAIDVGERIERDHPLDRQLSLHQEIDEPRDEFGWMALALDDAAHHPAELQERH